MCSGFLQVGYLEHSDEMERSSLSSVSNVHCVPFSFTCKWLELWHCSLGLLNA